MKRAIIGGILLGMAILCHPVQSEAHDQCADTIELTYEEAQELMEIAWCEAGNQGVSGQIYVMSVILNRVNSPDPAWPDTITEVIHQPHQFATKGMAKAKITPETHEALAEIEKGNLVPGIIAFETVSSTALDQYFSEAFTFRNHKFYTKKIN